MEKNLALITQIETLILRLNNKEKEQYNNSLNYIIEKYEKELNSLIDGELTVRPQSLIISEYYFELDELLTKVKNETDIMNIEYFATNLNLNKENFNEKLIQFDDLEKEYKRLKKIMDNQQGYELTKNFNKILYEFAYNEIKFYDDDSILQGLSEEEQIYITKLLIEKIYALEDRTMIELLYYYDMKNQSVLNKDVLINLIEIEHKMNNRENVIKKQNNDIEVTNKKKKSSFFNNLFKKNKRADKKISLFDLVKEYGYNSLGDIAKLPSDADFSRVDFVNHVIHDVDLSNRAINLDPQLVIGKSLIRTKLNNVDMSGKNFSKTILTFAELKNSNADIDPQKVDNKSLWGINLENVNMSDKNFDDVFIGCANLKNTNADINPQKIKDKDLRFTNLEGLDLSNKSFFEVHLFGANLKGANIEGANFIGAIDLDKALLTNDQKEYIDKQLSDINDNIKINKLEEIQDKIENLEELKALFDNDKSKNDMQESKTK